MVDKTAEKPDIMLTLLTLDESEQILKATDGKIVKFYKFSDTDLEQSVGEHKLEIHDMAKKHNPAAALAAGLVAVMESALELKVDTKTFQGLYIGLLRNLFIQNVREVNKRETVN